MKAFQFCGPNPSPLTKGEAIAISNVCELLPVNPVIVQIGAYIGASTIAILETRPDAFIFSIDIKPHLEERQNIVACNLDYTRVVRLLGDSSQMDFPYSVDLIFFDGDHRYDGIKADCERWLGKAKDYVLFHDYIPENAPYRNQVYEVVNEFFRDVEPFIRVERLIGFRFSQSTSRTA